MADRSVDSFGNDSAGDWSDRLKHADDLGLVRQTFQTVLAAEDYLEIDTACEGIAACEVVARLKGNWGKRDSASQTVDQWVEAHKSAPPADLVQMAISVVDRVLAPQSELMEIWEEGDPAEFRAAMGELRGRVGK
jgi:hypothetical protein